MNLNLTDDFKDLLGGWYVNTLFFESYGLLDKLWNPTRLNFFSDKKYLMYHIQK